MKAALFLFDYSGVMAEPWAAAGYDCTCVDLQHPAGETVLKEYPLSGGIIRAVGMDIEHYTPPQRDFRFAAAFTPCTDTAVSGSRWFKVKGLRALQKSIGLFARSEEILESLECPGFIENPVSTLSSYYRQPDHSFDPYQYTGYFLEDNYTKKTCIWAFGGFVMPEPLIFSSVQEAINRVTAAYGRMVSKKKAMEQFASDPLVVEFYPDQRIHDAPPTVDPMERTNFRNKTPRGFSRAVYNAHHPSQKELTACPRPR